MTLEPRHCALCGPAAPKHVKYPATFTEADLNATVFAARRSPDRVHFQLVECERCGLVFSDPACGAAELAHLYESAAVTYDEQEAQIYDAYAPLLDRALERLRIPRGRFLEIGGGRGFMLKWALDRGFAEAIEFEPSADAEKRFAHRGDPRASFRRGLFTPGAVEPGSVSFAAFFQMLDHVPDPRGFLTEVQKVLAPGGVALAVTHNTQAVSARVLGERSPIYDIEHTYLFAPGNLTALMTDVGLAEARAFPISNPYSVRTWFHLAPLPRPLKGALRPLFADTPLGRVRIPLRAGNFAAVAVKAATP